jgi:PAS domain S-box-containing protein
MTYSDVNQETVVSFERCREQKARLGSSNHFVLYNAVLTRYCFGEGTAMPNNQNAAALLNEIYSSVTDFAIFTLDNDGLVTTWNVGAERVLGYLESEVIGQHSALFFTPEDRLSGQPTIEIDTAKHCGRAVDVRWHQRKDGSTFWADGMLTTLRNENGELTGFLKIMKDVTERKLAEEKWSGWQRSMH